MCIVLTIIFYQTRILRSLQFTVRLNELHQFLDSIQRISQYISPRTCLPLILVESPRKKLE